MSLSVCGVALHVSLSGCGVSLSMSLSVCAMVFSVSQCVTCVPDSALPFSIKIPAFNPDNSPIQEKEWDYGSNIQLPKLQQTGRWILRHGKDG